MTSQFKNSSLIALALLVCLQTTIPAFASAPVAAVEAAKKVIQIDGPSSSSFLQLAVLTALAAGCMRIWTRDGSNAPVGYNLDELFEGKNVAYNLYKFADDGLVGQFGKGQYLYFDPATKTVDISKEVAPKGLGGWTAYYYKGVLAGLGTAYLLIIAGEEYTNAKGLNDIFITNFVNRLKNNFSINGMPDWFKMGMASILGGFVGSKLAASNK